MQNDRELDVAFGRPGKVAQRLANCSCRQNCGAGALEHRPHVIARAFCDDALVSRDGRGDRALVVSDKRSAGLISDCSDDMPPPYEVGEEEGAGTRPLSLTCPRRTKL